MQRWLLPHTVKELLLFLLTREDLRKMARSRGIRRGKDKKDTAQNLANDILFRIHFSKRLREGKSVRDM